MTPCAQNISRFLALALRTGLLCVALFLAVQTAHAEIVGFTPKKRIALIIGNASYQHVEKLINPTNDAIGISEALRDQGFDIFPANDTTRNEFNRIFEDFKTQAKSADVALVYFSGHGFQLNGTNYLVPVDAHLVDRAKIAEETISLDRIIADIQDANRQTLIFLDACRNNPLPDGTSAGLSNNTGLAQVNAGKNLFVAFATQPGNVSFDGTGSLSPFTKALVDHIRTPGLGIADVMMKVRNEVVAATLEKQTPWEQSSLQRPFYFSTSPSTGETQTAALNPAGSADQGLTRRADVENATQAPSANVTVVPEGGGLPLTVIDPQTGINPVIYMPEAPAEIFGQDDRILTMQTALQRVGCYTAEVDGSWGESSREAAKRYYATKKLQTSDTGPTEFLYDALQRESSVVCLYQPPRQAVAPKNLGPRNPVKSKAPRLASSQPQPQLQQTSAPPPAAASEKKGLRGSTLGGTYR